MNSNSFENLQRFLFVIVLVISSFIILTYLLSMGLGILVVFFTEEGLEFSKASYAGLYFLFFWLVFAFCFAAALKYRETLPSKVREFFFGTTKRSLFGNNLLAMPTITSMLLVATVALHFLQTQSGIPTNPPSPGDPFEDFLRFSQAPLIEEVLFRIIPIGTVLVTYISLSGKRAKPDFSWSQRLKTCILSVFQPEKAKKMVGLKTIGKDGLFGGLIWAEWVVVLLTAFIFSLAHYFSGWGLGKIPQTAISGVIFGFAYLYYGIQAPILLHWYFNYYFTAFDLSVDYYSITIDFLSFSWSVNIFLGVFLYFAIMIFSLIVVLKALRRKHNTISILELPSANV